MLADLEVHNTGAPAPQNLDITFDSHGDRLIGLGFLNALLRVLSLGIYSFWAKTEVRRRLWSFTRLNGEPLEYTGTGKELFLGFLIVFVTLFIPLALSGLAVAVLFKDSQAAAFQVLLYIGFFLLIGNAIYRAQRYRMSRTQWRGIRGALVGSPAGYGWMYFWTLAAPFMLVAVLAFLTSHAVGPQVGGVIILLGLVLGLWVLPWRSNKLQRTLTNDMRFGDRPLTYSGTAGPLYKRYLYAWFGSALVYLAALGTTANYVIRSGNIVDLQLAKISISLVEILTLVAIWIIAIFASTILTAWYRASQYRHFAEHTHFEGATFSLDATGKGLMWLVVSNWLMQIFALLLGFIIATPLLMALGAMPESAEAQISAEAIREPGLIATILAIMPIIFLTTVAATFAQFRWARYFVSRLKLSGPIDLSSILQAQDQGIKRGEGLAQVFDIDAF